MVAIIILDTLHAYLLPMFGLDQGRLLGYILWRIGQIFRLELSPSGFLGFTIGPGLIALKRLRRFWPWALCGFAFGPVALMVIALPRGQESRKPIPGDTQGCPQRGSPYWLSDFRPDAKQWLCLICKHELPREPQTNLVELSSQ
jgi:hypothetical protein